MFSDGYSSQLGGIQNQTFKSHQFKEILLKNCHHSMAIQKDVLENTIEEWKSYLTPSGECHDQTDDILVIGVRV